MSGVFVTGTDTGVGKTFASCALLGAWRARGLRASGMKPVASGCEETPPGLRSEDALALIAASDPAPAYADCNPFAYAPAIAPHVAARLAQRPVSLNAIVAAHARIAARCDRVAVEAESYGELRNGRIYAQEYHLLMTIQGGKIRAVREYMDTAHVQAVWYTR